MSSLIQREDDEVELEQGEDLKEKKKEFVHYKYRWVVLTVFCLAMMSNGFTMTCFSGFAPVVAEIYDTSEVLVGVASELFIFMYVPFNFPFVWMIDNWGVRFSVTAGSVLMVIGVWMRLIVVLEPNFYWVLLGQTFAAIAAPLLSNSSAKLATLWFKPSERGVATSLGVVFLELGLALAFKMPSWYFDANKEDYKGRHEEGRRQMEDFLMMWAIVTTVCCFLAIVFMRGKPPTPPSKTA